MLCWPETKSGDIRWYQVFGLLVMESGTAMKENEPMQDVVGQLIRTRRWVPAGNNGHHLGPYHRFWHSLTCLHSLTHFYSYLPVLHSFKFLIVLTHFHLYRFVIPHTHSHLPFTCIHLHTFVPHLFSAAGMCLFLCVFIHSHLSLSIQWTLLAIHPTVPLLA